MEPREVLVAMESPLTLLERLLCMQLVVEVAVHRHHLELLEQGVAAA